MSGLLEIYFVGIGLVEMLGWIEMCVVGFVEWIFFRILWVWGLLKLNMVKSVGLFRFVLSVW